MRSIETQARCCTSTFTFKYTQTHTPSLGINTGINQDTLKPITSANFDPIVFEIRQELNRRNVYR